MAITAPTVQPYPVIPAPFCTSFTRKREPHVVRHETSVQAGCSGASSRASLRRASTIPGSLTPMRPLLLPVSADCISCPSTLARMAGRRQGDRQAGSVSVFSRTLRAAKCHSERSASEVRTLRPARSEDSKACNWRRSLPRWPGVCAEVLDSSSLHSSE